MTGFDIFSGKTFIRRCSPKDPLEDDNTLLEKTQSLEKSCSFEEDFFFF